MSVLGWFKEHSKTTFWIRFIFWFIFACALPFAFIVWRFKLFTTISSIQIGGWGIIAIVIVVVFALTVVRYVRMALSARYSLMGQCLSGFCKVVLPLLAFLALLQSVKSNIDLLMQAVGCVVLCETVAIPINPLPKWAYEAQKDVRVEERKEAVDYLLDGFFSRKESEEKSK